MRFSFTSSYMPSQHFIPFLLLAQSKTFAQQLFLSGQRRTLFKPPANIPYFGLYRTNGEICRQDDILVCQRKMNYHPGANVRWHSYRGLQLLKANCDGTVLITREKCDLNTELEIVQKYYTFRDFKDIYKLTFNVIPRRLSNTFLLIDEE